MNKLDKSGACYNKMFDTCILCSNQMHPWVPSSKYAYRSHALLAAGRSHVILFSACLGIGFGTAACRCSSRQSGRTCDNKHWVVDAFVLAGAIGSMANVMGRSPVQMAPDTSSNGGVCFLVRSICFRRILNVFWQMAQVRLSKVLGVAFGAWWMLHIINLAGLALIPAPARMFDDRIDPVCEMLRRAP